MSFLQGTKRTAISTSYVCLLAGLCITLQIQATGFCRAGAVGVAVAFNSHRYGLNWLRSLAAGSIVVNSGGKFS